MYIKDTKRLNGIAAPTSLSFEQLDNCRNSLHTVKEADTQSLLDAHWQKRRFTLEESMDTHLDLSCHTKPYQIIVAKMDLINTLAGTIRELHNRISGYASKKTLFLGAILSVPNLEFQITHRFRELELDPIAIASQRVKFKLDRFGAELESSADLRFIGGGFQTYSLDRPFLILMRKRDCERPFFVTWVDNADLLKPM